MRNARKFLADPRQRLIALLGIVAAAGVLFAGISLHIQNSSTAPDSRDQLLLPGLSEKLHQVARIHIESRVERFDVVFNPQKGWVLPDKNGYPASLEQVRQTLGGLANLEIMEAKTSRKDWLSFLGLDAPSAGKGTAVTLFGNKTDKIASVILGKTSDIGDKNGGVGLFVRMPDSSKSWLVRSNFMPRTKQLEWMDKNVLSIPQGRIRSIDVEPNGGRAFSMARTGADRGEFAVTPSPMGHVDDPQRKFEIADALADFPFDNAVPTTAIDFSKADRMVFRTFDGLMITVLAIKKDGEYWSTLEASPIQGIPGAEKAARGISAHINGWAYKLPSYKGVQFMPTLESLSKSQAPQK